MTTRLALLVLLSAACTASISCLDHQADTHHITKVAINEPKTEGAHFQVQHVEGNPSAEPAQSTQQHMVMSTVMLAAIYILCVELIIMNGLEILTVVFPAAPIAVALVACASGLGLLWLVKMFRKLPADLYWRHNSLADRCYVLLSAISACMWYAYAKGAIPHGSLPILIGVAVGLGSLGATAICRLADTARYPSPLSGIDVTRPILEMLFQAHIVVFCVWLHNTEAFVECLPIPKALLCVLGATVVMHQYLGNVRSAEVAAFKAYFEGQGIL